MNRFFFIGLSLLASIQGMCEKSIVNDDRFSRQIIENQPDAVLFYDSEKLYLRPEKIHATAQGIYLGDGTSGIALPCLFADNAGCYLPRASRPSSGYWTCGNRHCINYDKVWYGSRNCPICNLPGDPV